MIPYLLNDYELTLLNNVAFNAKCLSREANSIILVYSQTKTKNYLSLEDYMQLLNIGINLKFNKIDIENRKIDFSTFLEKLNEFSKK